MVSLGVAFFMILGMQAPPLLQDMMKRHPPKPAPVEEVDLGAMIRKMNEEGGLGRVVCNLEPERPGCGYPLPLR